MKKLCVKIEALVADDLLRHTAILFAGMMGVHICNLVYQMAVIRVLPGEEYALLAAFLGVLAIISYPLSTLTTGLSHYSSLLLQEGRVGDVKRLLRKWLLLTGIPAMLLGTAIILFTRPVAGFMNLNRFAPVIIAGMVLPAMFWLPVLTGTAQGLQLFGWCSGSAIAGAFVKLLLGAGFVWFLYPACGWAMLGHSAGVYVSVTVLVLGLLIILRGGVKTEASLPSMRFYLLQSFFVLTAFAVLMNADVVLVKHYLPDETGFAVAATLGRIVPFLSATVAVAMFPKVTSSGGTTAVHRRIFFRSFGFTALFVVAAASGCFLFPRLLLRILGSHDTAASTVFLTRLMTAAMSASSLLYVVLQFLLAQRRFKETLPVVAAGLLYLLSACFFHRASWQIATATAASNTLALLVGLWSATRKRDCR